MGLKKYEIITVGGDKRVRALRSWQVGDRYVNIGDVGGIVYDEKTLSQDGLCWLFKGNFGFPGARIGGDSIVDVGETTLSATGTPNVDILGSSVVVGGVKVRFESDQTAENAVVLTAADFEQGAFASYVNGQKPGTVNSANYVRTKNPIFLGGKSLTISLSVPGYRVLALVTDRDGLIVTGTSETATGVGVTLTIPAGQYGYLRLTKDPVGATVPADATAAQIKFTGVYETSLSVIDSRVEINPVTSVNTLFIKPGGSYAIASGVKYPDSIIRNSTVSINTPAAANSSVRFVGQFTGSNATLDVTGGNLTLAGQYSNVKNLIASGALTTIPGTVIYSSIQATDCDNFAVSAAIFPGYAAAMSANTPFIFQGCNVPNGMFYHHAQIKNTYVNIDFAKAQADLGKQTENGYKFCSAEVEGMYRLVSTGSGVIGALAEAHDSVKSLNMTGTTNTYGTTIYKDAYFNGRFDFAGTNVFGHKVRSHPLAQVLNVQPRAVRGIFNATAVGGKITGVVDSATLVCVPKPFRVNSSRGLTISNLPAGYEAVIFLADANDVITRVQSTTAANTDLAASALVDVKAFIRFKRVDNAPADPDALAGVTVTVYNGCKIVNTGSTAVNLKGNIRVEDNATLVNASITGSGYFGGNSVVYYNAATWAPLPMRGVFYMKDNAVYAPASIPATFQINYVRMTENAKHIGSGSASATAFTMRDNALMAGAVGTISHFDMSGNSRITTAGSLASNSRGYLFMRENASVEGSLSFFGDITLQGNYKQTVAKTWEGKRKIDSVDAPDYSNNVRTQYDF